MNQLLMKWNTKDIEKTIISVNDKLTNGVKFKIITIKVTGSTENNASFNLTNNILFIFTTFLFHIFLIIT